SIAFVDRPLRVVGPYVLDLALDLGELPNASAREWSAAVGAEADTRGGDAEYLLAAIGDAVELRSGALARAAYDRAVRERLVGAGRHALPRRAAARPAVDRGVRRRVHPRRVQRGRRPAGRRAGPFPGGGRRGLRRGRGPVRGRRARRARHAAHRVARAGAAPR